MTKTQFKAYETQSPELAEFLALQLGVSVAQIQLWRVTK